MEWSPPTAQLMLTASCSSAVGLILSIWEWEQIGSDCLGVKWIELLYLFYKKKLLLQWNETKITRYCNSDCTHELVLSVSALLTPLLLCLLPCLLKAMLPHAAIVADAQIALKNPTSASACRPRVCLSTGERWWCSVSSLPAVLSLHLLFGQMSEPWCQTSVLCIFYIEIRFMWAEPSLKHFSQQRGSVWGG